MRKIVYIFIPLLLVSCGFNITGNGDPNHREQEIYYEHRPLHFYMSLDCKKEACVYGFTYDWYQYSKYTLKNEKGEFEIGTQFELPEDGHIRFSIFDYNKSERKYDIDMSEYAHSYRIFGDSVEITLPLGTEVNVYYDIPFVVSRDFTKMLVDTLSENKFVFRDDSSFYGYYCYSKIFSVTDYVGSDIIDFHGCNYWRLKE